MGSAAAAATPASPGAVAVISEPDSQAKTSVVQLEGMLLFSLLADPIFPSHFLLAFVLKEGVAQQQRQR